MTTTSIIRTNEQPYVPIKKNKQVLLTGLLGTIQSRQRQLDRSRNGIEEVQAVADPPNKEQILLGLYKELAEIELELTKLDEQLEQFGELYARNEIKKEVWAQKADAIDERTSALLQRQDIIESTIEEEYKIQGGGRLHIDKEEIDQAIQEGYGTGGRATEQFMASLLDRERQGPNQSEDEESNVDSTDAKECDMKQERWKRRKTNTFCPQKKTSRSHSDVPKPHRRRAIDADKMNRTPRPGFLSLEHGAMGVIPGFASIFFMKQTGKMSAFHL